MIDIIKEQEEYVIIIAEQWKFKEWDTAQLVLKDLLEGSQKFKNDNKGGIKQSGMD